MEAGLCVQQTGPDTGGKQSPDLPRSPEAQNLSLTEH